MLVAYLTLRAFELAYSVKISNVRNPRRYVCIVLLIYIVYTRACENMVMLILRMVTIKHEEAL